ncbi:MAG: protein kinase [Anaerolineae bacterium]|nr:protein kinase [Anaerolineae bacterium]
MQDLSGAQLGPYRIVERIGEGGMATVYKAYQPSVDRFVALKVLPAHYAADPSFLQRFQQEARVIARLEHPNIIPVHDFGEQDGVTYLVMRYLQAGSLKDILRGGPLALADTVRVVAQVASALDYAHRQGVVHRDIKPANVLVDTDGNAFLTDFGIAKILEGNIGLTATGGTLGTPAYMAPEQSMSEPVDARADIYSLGVTLYEMLTGRVPFDADTPVAVILKHLHDPLPLPRQFNPAIPESVERIVLRAMAKKADDRYHSAAEMSADLERAVTSAETHPAQGAALRERAALTAQLRSPAVVTGELRARLTAPSEPPGATATGSTPRERRLIALAGVAVVVAVVAIVLLLSQLLRPAQRQPRHRPRRPPSRRPPHHRPRRRATRPPGNRIPQRPTSRRRRTGRRSRRSSTRLRRRRRRRRRGRDAHRCRRPADQHGDSDSDRDPDGDADGLRHARLPRPPPTARPCRPSWTPSCCRRRQRCWRPIHRRTPARPRRPTCPPQPARTRPYRHRPRPVHPQRRARTPPPIRPSQPARTCPYHHRPRPVHPQRRARTPPPERPSLTSGGLSRWRWPTWTRTTRSTRRVSIRMPATGAWKAARRTSMAAWSCRPALPYHARVGA